MMKLVLQRLIQTRLMMKLYPKNRQFQQPYSKTPILSKNKWEVELHNTDNNSLHPALQNRYDSFTKHNNISDRSYSQKTSCRKVSPTTTTYLTDPILQIHAGQFHQPQHIWPILFSKYMRDSFTNQNNISDRSYSPNTYRTFSPSMTTYLTDHMR